MRNKVFFIIFLQINVFILINSQQLYEGDICDKGNGVCTVLSKCKAVIDNLRKGIRNHTTCTYNGVLPIVCCPRVIVTVVQKPLSKSEQKCLDYSKFAYEKEAYYPPGSNQVQYVDVNRCGRTATGFIVGGTAALPREFPHMGLVGYQELPTEEIMWACGCTLISEKHALTAGHCLYNINEGDAKYVKLGDLDYLRDDDEASPVTLAIIERIKHPDYKTSSQYNDIAILVLERNVEFNIYVRPACLPEGASNFDLVIATGWGQVEWGGLASNELQKVTLQTFTYQECNQTYRYDISRRLTNGIDDTTQLCCGSKSESKDTCQGDSGGPIQIIHSTIHCSYIIVGITSFGKGCGAVNIPGVYTRVLTYKPWIESIIWP